MSLKDEITNEVKKIFREGWSERDGLKVPDVTDVRLGNDAVKLDATVLYADMADSTKLVDSQEWQFTAEIYKTYLHCASKIIKNESGVITAFDGDRVMALFLGNRKNTNAARCALRIKWAITHIINPALKAQYPSNTFELRHVVGIDSSLLRAARTGVWGSNDLVWVGRAANYAAKLSNINEGVYSTIITETVYNNLNNESKYSNGTNMWEMRSATIGGIATYRSSYHWGL